jgi:hypothetical protein
MAAVPAKMAAVDTCNGAPTVGNARGREGRLGACVTVCPEDRETRSMAAMSLLPCGVPERAAVDTCKAAATLGHARGAGNVRDDGGEGGGTAGS